MNTSDNNTTIHQAISQANEHQGKGGKESLRIVYMGTPDFAVESLRALVEGGYNVVGVITMPDKPIGRHGSVLQPSPIKQYYLDNQLADKGVKLMQPEKLKDEQFVEELRALRADLQIVVAFRMLPEIVWNMPRLGTFNLHASLLPQYRGAAPLNWAIINGDKETGITTFFLKHEIDTGSIIQQVRIPIGDDDNVGDIHDRLMVLGGRLVTETVDNIIVGNIHPIEQEEVDAGELRPAPKIFHDTCRIDWHQTVWQVHNFVRGLSPYPAAWTTLMDGDKAIDVKIYKTRLTHNRQAAHNGDSEGIHIENAGGSAVGSIHTDGKSYLQVQCSDGVIDVLTLQVAGKKRMDIIDFLRGFKTEKLVQFS